MLTVMATVGTNGSAGVKKASAYLRDMGESSSVQYFIDIGIIMYVIPVPILWLPGYYQ